MPKRIVLKHSKIAAHSSRRETPSEAVNLEGKQEREEGDRDDLRWGHQGQGAQRLRGRPRSIQVFATSLFSLGTLSVDYIL